MGLLDPKTSDGIFAFSPISSDFLGRVVFLLPWENQTIAGTTDHLGGIEIILHHLR